MIEYTSIIPRVHHISKRSHHPQWTTKETNARFHEIMVVIRGNITYVIDGTSYTIEEGTVAYLPQGVRNYVEPQHGNSFVMYLCLFTCEYVADATHRLPFSTGMIKPASKRVVSLFKQMHYSFLEKNTCYKLENRGYLQLIIAELATNHTERPMAALSNPRVIQMKLHIKRHLHEKVKPHTIREITGLNPDYFASLFKKDTGYTIPQYINRCRIEKAKDLLVSGNQKIIEISHLCGFEDELYFTKLFKKRTGMPPTEFRNNH